MPLSRGWIESHIPHKGRMCLLDEVVDWGPDRICCRGGSHRAADHPLCAHGRLGIACGIEFAAQAMAVHGALTAAASDLRSASGLLASVRGVRMYVSRLDDVQADLICDALRVAGDGETALYEFELRSSTMRLMTGRAMVVLNADARLRP